MNILAIDIGTTTGWATNKGLGDSFALGQWELATKAEVTLWRKQNLTRRCDPRFHRLWDKVFMAAKDCDVVIFEDVEFATYNYQAQLWSVLRGAIWAAAPAESLECVPVSELKKFATGKGNADKEHMLEAMLDSEPERFSLDDSLKSKHVVVDTEAMMQDKGDHLLTSDAVDAYWLYRWAKKNITR